MHPSPLRYLDGDPAEAAEFLAKTLVASRMVGGYVKVARMEKRSVDLAKVWDQLGKQLGPGGRTTLVSSLAGAGAGGLGGAALGMVGNKRRPGRSALNGAMIGGLLGGAGGALYGIGTAPTSMPQQRQQVAKAVDSAAAKADSANPAVNLVADPARKAMESTGLATPAAPGSELSKVREGRTFVGNAVGTGKMVGDSAAADPAPYLAGGAAAGGYLGTRGSADMLADTRAGINKARSLRGTAVANSPGQMGAAVPGLAEAEAAVGTGRSFAPFGETAARSRLGTALKGPQGSAIKDLRAVGTAEHAAAQAAKGSVGRFVGGRGVVPRLGKAGLIALGTGLATEYGPGMIEQATGKQMPSLQRYFNTGSAFRPGP